MCYNDISEEFQIPREITKKKKRKITSCKKITQSTILI